MAKSPYEVMDLKALRCFWATAKHANMTQGGIELGISEAAVSQRIKALERYLGAKLYESRGGRIRLTLAGEQTMEMAFRLFDELEDFEGTVGAEAAAVTITLAAGDAVLRYLLPDVIQQFSQDHRFSHLRLISRTTSQIIKLVRANDADLGIIPKRRSPKELQFHPTRTYKAYVLLPRGHSLSRRGKPNVVDLLNEEILKRYPLVVPEVDDPEHQPIAKALEQRGLPYNVGLEVGSIETVKHYVHRGLGIAVVSGLCLTEQDHDALDTIEVPGDVYAGTTYGVIHRHDKYLTAPLEGLMALLGVIVATK